MEITISGHHVEITPAINAYTKEKLSILEKFDAITSLDVVLSVEKERQKAEANIHVTGSTFHAEAITEDMYHSIDALEQKLAKQLKKHREKNTEHSAKKKPAKKQVESA